MAEENDLPEKRPQTDKDAQGDQQPRLDLPKEGQETGKARVGQAKRDDKRHTTYFIKEVFDPCFDEYIQTHHVPSEKSPSFRVASDILGFADEMLSKDKRLSKKELQEAVTHVFFLIEDFPQDEELKHSSLAFAHKVKTVYGFDPKHLWIHVFVRPSDLPSLQKKMGRTMKIIIALMVILLLVFAVLVLTREPPGPESLTIIKNITREENRTFMVNRTITESYEIPLTYEAYIDNARKVQGEQVTLTGYLMKELVQKDDVGEMVRYIIDDAGRRIIVLSVDEKDDERFPLDTQGKQLYQITGTLKDAFEGLTIQARGKLKEGKQPTATRDKVITVEEIRPVNVTEQVNETILVMPKK
ncbi:MAG: hypothetical protein GXP63_06265 [DPANN group archaeon]|nr:hypothetical protein [DPANN group archaeon]